MNKQRRKQIRELMERAEDLKAEIDEILEEEQDYEAAKTYGHNINFDVSVNYNYDSKNISGYEAFSSLGQLTGSAFGYDVSEFLDLSLVNKVL